MLIFSAIGALWNLLGDLAACAFAWGWYWLVSQYLWRLPFVSLGWETFALWHLAIPLTIGFLVEHGLQVAAQVLAILGIGIKGDKGITPFVVPAGLNWLVFLLWNLIMWLWPVAIAVIIIIVIVLVIKARRSHP